MDFQSSKTNTQIKLQAGSEWRFEVDFTQELTVKVLSGIVEINGTELPNNIEFKFKGIKSSIFAYQDALIQYHGSLSSEYVSEESVINQYVALHMALQNYRNQAKQENSTKNSPNIKAPRVLIVGPKDSGKTTLAKVLASYAVKMDSLPMLVNLNPAEGVYTVPGALSAVVINDIFDVEQGWGHSILSGASVFHPTQPAVSFYGYEHININPKYFKYCYSQLAKVVETRLNEDEAVRSSGVIIDTPPLSNKNFNVIEDLVDRFQINVVIVLGNERLFIDVKKRFSAKINEKPGDPDFFNILKIGKSGGCVEKDEAFIRAQQQQQIKQYFYGERKSVLSPYTITFVDYEKINVYKINESGKDSSGPEDPNNVDVSSVLPIGEGVDEEERKMLQELKQSSADSAAAGGDKANSNSKDESIKSRSGTAASEDSNASVDEMVDSSLAEKIEPASSYLQNSVIAFVHANKGQSLKDILSSGVMCFGYVSEANDTKKKINVLLPVQANFPNKVILLGGFRYVD